MRLLLMLLLACIISETSDTGVKFGKLYASKSKKNTPLFNLKPLSANVIDECIDNQEVNPFFAELNSLPKIRINIKKKIIPRFCGFNNEKYKYQVGSINIKMAYSILL
ncbi:uncharacterized protein LOC122536043 [Frieseomelitta varia]|uniref:uncharacterized protein LOC122536043 n=1 Tax=Frieseomelitta varia TaxID=561572 RepID=UPI001CB6897F|nr:uncharacterized protein LOC122536043 [Frieseomelitta varia]